MEKEKKLKKSFALAGLISLATAALHVFGGGPEIHEPLLASNLTLSLKVFYSVIWHQITALFLVTGAALLYAAKNLEGRRAIAIFSLAQLAAFSVLFLYYCQSYLGTIWLHPQWVIFLTMGVLILIGLRQKNGQSA